jgi:hypothetical protein
MKFKEARPFPALEKSAERKLLELANAVEADHAGRPSKQSTSWMNLCAIVVFGITDAAHAEQFVRTVNSGQTALMYSYASWTKDCQPAHGVVKVLTKPRHGRLFPSKGNITVTRSRFAEYAHCIGMKINGFKVEYRSTPGYHGTDSFTIEAAWGTANREVDHYTVTVR